MPHYVTFCAEEPHVRLNPLTPSAPPACLKINLNSLKPVVAVYGLRIYARKSNANTPRIDFNTVGIVTIYLTR